VTSTQQTQTRAIAPPKLFRTHIVDLTSKLENLGSPWTVPFPAIDPWPFSMPRLGSSSSLLNSYISSPQPFQLVLHGVLFAKQGQTEIKVSIEKMYQQREELIIKICPWTTSKMATWKLISVWDAEDSKVQKFEGSPLGQETGEHQPTMLWFFRVTTGDCYIGNSGTLSWSPNKVSQIQEIGTWIW
jgi:hypothetical protein